MPRGKTQKHVLRRQFREEHRAECKERKRQRRLRAEIHAAMETAKRLAWQPDTVDGPWRAPDIKTDDGWVVESMTEDFATTAGSRDKARAMAREANAGDITIQRMPSNNVDAEMEKLGWVRVSKIGHVEERFVRSTS